MTGDNYCPHCGRPMRQLGPDNLSEPEREVARKHFEAQRDGLTSMLELAAQRANAERRELFRYTRGPLAELPSYMPPMKSECGNGSARAYG